MNNTSQHNTQGADALDFLTSLTNDIQASQGIKSQLVERELIQLTPNLEGYEVPQNFGVYKQGGGNILGVVGKDYQPMNLNRFYDVIEQSIIECSTELNLSKLEYKEYFGGKKIAFTIPLKSKVVQSGMTNDIIDFKLLFQTGFDGLTKTSINFLTYRQICSNGMKGWASDLALSFKNTKGNNGRELLICNDIFTAINGAQSYVKTLENLAAKKITPKDVQQFVSKLTGYDVEKPASTKQANILNDIMTSINLEMQTTGSTAFSLLQGITRHTTHYKAKGVEESILFETANKMNHQALQLVEAM